MSERVKKWTPGHWEVSEQTASVRSEDFNQLAQTVADPGAGMRIHWDMAQRLANARLIASAPALVEALEDLLASNGGGPKSCGHDFTCVCAEDKAKAALALAYGETQ